MKETDQEIITIGSHVIVQRLNFKKVYRVSESGSLALGKEEIKMSGIIGKPYWTTFKVVSNNHDTAGKNHKKSKRNTSFSLVVAENTDCLEDLKNVVSSSGFDNRSIVDDGKSQKLSKDDILNLKDLGKSSREIVSSLIENNASFSEKTEYSQEKYIKKKEKKYCQFLTILKPTLPLLQEIYLRQDPGKINALRMDTLAQLFSYCDVKANGTFMLYDSGTAGLAVAGMLSRIGSSASGNLVYLHSGDHLPQMPILRAMNFKQEYLSRLSIASIFDFLKSYNADDNFTDKEDSKKVENVNCENSEVNIHNSSNLKRKHADDTDEGPLTKKSRKLQDLENAVQIIKTSKVDGLLIVTKEHPLNIIQLLLTYLKVSKPFVVYHVHREPLQEAYVALKQQSNVINLKLYSNFLRSYQILPDRTHPDILTNDCGGYILTGYLVDKTETDSKALSE